MDFSLTEAQQDLTGIATKVLREWADKNSRRDTTGFDAQLWRSFVTTGLLDAALPKTVGGNGFGILEQCSILTEIGRFTAPVPYLSSILVGVAAIAEFGDADQIERWALPVVQGDLAIGLALGAGVTVTESRLSGTQTAVTAGAFADAFLVVADGGLHLVDRLQYGVTVTPQRLLDADDGALLELDNVEAVFLGGAHAVAWALRRATLGWCAWQLGVLEQALSLTTEYARTRKQFGIPIGGFQAVRARIAETYIDVEAVRLTQWQAAYREAAGLASEAEIAIAKFWASEAGHRVAHTAVHIHGGVGIDTDGPVHRYYVAAKRAEFSLGGATAQLRALGALLAHEPA
ncbi:acyl-CoA dehydrogenase family protein [Nocardia pseudobrasiliensis]|uniref:Alkylation response protein AidB-like acyl-CoA dehydrogenase n=1 Tax=Nocardia pseudobrasiliensis TaxID=45979 RepID=A0A370HPV8_9NOCA|nr:acyl-CoA dehydrogenase family protein [Nocardia pseudobrasiliensis]RDI60528.1 alkylation response protein AidB-like acyl-CoA dehydrogenase [Nocardia pseudobrasiliensis]